MPQKEELTHSTWCAPNSPAVERHVAGLLCVFYGMINLAVNNSYIVYAHRPENKDISRRKFGSDLAVSLCRPHANVRLEQARYLPREVVSSIVAVFNLPDPTIQAAASHHQQKSEKRHRCRICPSDGMFRGKVLCILCQKAMCPKHTYQVCSQCYDC